MSIDEQATLAHAFVAGLLERLGMTASTEVSTSEELETIDVSVEGDGLGLLIGPHGATLGALQELTRTVVQRHTSEHSARVIVDVAGYRAKRAAALAQFARRIADEVLASGTPRALEPMSASDRKVVHDTVNELEGVATSSEGEGDDRHVVIRATGTAPAAPDAVTNAEPGDSAAAESDVSPPAAADTDEAVAPAAGGDADDAPDDDDYTEIGDPDAATDAR
jgi:spoIIIJ-associated protein